ncbi:hypothetical protein [Alteraurantiacibacter buctensis]|uniref:Uncharacterized protein n=1 Tax=Alteraurantiacibacter buctensis TaxID=1503981 RepID=A0A844YZQ9_9SPHN|nr:hypothetical protein [Alteraurantiacibacter buctensis]MXO72251.1 hypothetical protein [Alteraurantiacibacter buctensis]
MSKKFILSTDVLSAEEERQLKEKLKGMGYWHWLPNFWLIKSISDTVTASQINSMIEEVAPHARCFVTEVEAMTWAARTLPDANGNDMGKWIRNEWQTP